MRKMAAILFFFTFTLVGCQSSTSIGITELDEVDNEIKESIVIGDALQLMHFDEHTYLIFYSSGDVLVDFEEDEETIIVHFDVINEYKIEIKQYIYELTVEPEHEAIDVYINGELTPIDNIVV